MYKIAKARITEENLWAIIAEQRVKGPTGQNHAEGLEFCEVQTLDLGARNIARIECLWEFTSLTTLHLNNNYIQKIEGLSRLTNLKSLNLSFNNIMKIEGLESLTKLEELNLCNNRISVLENIDFLENLYQLYWKPLSEEENYKSFIIAFFPNLKYLDYSYINRESKKQASVRFQIDLEQLNVEEAEKEKKSEALKTQQAQQQMHMDAFVESLNGSFLFERMFKDDPLANKLKSVPEIASQQKPYPSNLSILMNFLLKKAAATTQTFQTSAYKDTLKKLQKQLLTLEFNLIGQIEMMIKKLDVVLTEMIGTFNESKVQGIVAVTIENVARDHGVEDLSDEVKMVFLDKETVMGALTTAHENHLGTLRDRENQLITRANAWKTRLLKKLQEKELQRNRMALSHITTYVDHYEEELHNLLNR
ncbi:hypothetical protein WMY93_003638 [Mugilogobius chulae]|uniref:Dynein regulatory complex subunit 3 n=1 Tax=Mugilogobius chulae TaxID=88201 RepID=A0AAW0Q723_9GOBI